MSATEPNIIIGSRPDGTPWVIAVEFGGKVTIGSLGELRCDRKDLPLDQARERAAALLAAIEWIENDRSAELEKPASDTVELVEDEACNCQAIPGTPNYPGPWHERGGEPHYPCSQKA